MDALNSSQARLADLQKLAVVGECGFLIPVELPPGLREMSMRVSVEDSGHCTVTWEGTGEEGCFASCLPRLPSGWKRGLVEIGRLVGGRRSFRIVDRCGSPGAR